MNLKIAEGLKERGIVVGNAYDKYNSQNPIVRWMMQGFESTLSEFVADANPQSIYEIGCGEGYWVLKWIEQGLKARGCDFSKQVIQIARDNALRRKACSSLFDVHSIYDLESPEHSADLIVCCEVLEHLENPDLGLQALQRIIRKKLIVSVPQEPLWRVLNCLRGKYLSHFGNTPGHIQHWSKKEFIQWVSKYFDVIEARTPLPWTMLLCQPISQ